MSTDYTNIGKEYAEGNARYNQGQRATVEHGASAQFPTFLRYVILETIFDPSSIDTQKLDYWEHTLGVTNMTHARVAPRNAIIARRVNGPGTSPQEPVMVLYPFFPPTISFPCKPGEHVWVMFEDPSGSRNDLGYWMCRIVGPSFVEDVNHTHAPRAYDGSFVPGTQEQFEGNDDAVYEFRNGAVGKIDEERYTDATSAMIDGGDDAYKKLMTESDGGRLATYEPVPRYRKRPGEVAFEGTNNTLIVFGQDRQGSVATYVDDPELGTVPAVPDTDAQGPEAGMIDVVVGRGQTPRTGGNPVTNDLPATELGKSQKEVVTDEGDPDVANDRTRIRVSQRTRVDQTFELEDFNGEFNSGKFQGSASNVNGVDDSSNGDAAAVIKTDKIRLIARSDIEILVTTYERDDAGRMVTVDDTSKWAAIVIKANGDVVFRPAEKGYIKLGGDDADRALLCTDFPAIAEEGNVTAAALVTTMGGLLGGTGFKNQGSYAKKILVTGG